MEEKRLEDLTINELKELAESEGIELTATKKANIIAEINKARELDITDNKENNQDDDTSNDTDIDVSTDNKDNEESEVTDEEAKEQNKSADEVNKKIKEDIEIPKGFVKKSNLNKKEYGYHNGRKYKKMKNGYGMWADNGQSFLLSELK